jgi:hypothetical protein
MEPHTTPDLTLQLPRDTYWLVVHTLHRSLPPPPTDNPDDQARRDRAAIAEVASMLPGNAEEASLAAQYVATKAYALHCLQAARDHPGDIACLLKCTAQAARMTHEQRGLRTLLQRLQAERRRREANPDATNSAAWVEHCAIGLMAQELPDPPPPAPPPERQPAQASPPEPQPADPEPWDETAADDEAPPDAVTCPADLYAVMYPRRAAQIRAQGGLPQPCDFGPPSPELVHAIVTGTSPTLLALDRENAMA